MPDPGDPEERSDAMQKLEEDPPKDLKEWPDDERKYETFGGPEGDHGYEEGPEARLGPSGLRHHEDGSVSIDGDKVDDPDEYKADPIPGGPTDPNATGPDIDKKKDDDVCVPPERIAEATKDLQALLGEHEFLPGVAGHASAGNLHFQLTPDLSKPEDRERYERFMERLVDLIVDKYDGSLKAEHGTGVNMAPYVEREWGHEATAIMWEVKRLADPHGVLNPGVVLNRDPGVHLRDLKTQPLIEEVAAHCVECGFCEPVGPSRNVTTTPRQRIVLRREMARQPEGSPVYEALMAEYDYDALQTCAADGTCSNACPVAIDTGKLVKEFRRRERTEREEAVAERVARRYAQVERAARGGLRAAHATAALTSDRVVAAVPDAIRRRVSADLVPAWTDGIPPAARHGLPETDRASAAAVYLPACINRIFGSGSERSIPDVLVELSARAGRPVWI